VVLIAERGHWRLTRHTRDDGSGYTKLEEKGEPGDWPSARVDFPVRYADGRVEYEHPAKLPKRVKVWVASELDRYVKGVKDERHSYG
jgi:hypothetical protein